LLSALLLATILAAAALFAGALILVGRRQCRLASILVGPALLLGATIRIRPPFVTHRKGLLRSSRA
jgi:hypothetical protein